MLCYCCLTRIWQKRVGFAKQVYTSANNLFAMRHQFDDTLRYGPKVLVHSSCVFTITHLFHPFYVFTHYPFFWPILCNPYFNLCTHTLLHKCVPMNDWWSLFRCLWVNMRWQVMMQEEAVFLLDLQKQASSLALNSTGLLIVFELSDCTKVIPKKL